MVASGWLLCEKSAVRALSADYRGWYEVILEQSIAFNLVFLIMSGWFLCVDLCEKNFPKSAKTCHYVENLLNSKCL